MQSYIKDQQCKTPIIVAPGIELKEELEVFEEESEVPVWMYVVFPIVGLLIVFTSFYFCKKTEKPKQPEKHVPQLDTATRTVDTNATRTVETAVNNSRGGTIVENEFRKIDTSK